MATASQALKLIALVFIAILILNMIFFALGWISSILFWAIIAGIGYVTWKHLGDIKQWLEQRF